MEAMQKGWLGRMWIDEIKRLHPGIIARYRLRPAEFEVWQEARKL